MSVAPSHGGPAVEESGDKMPLIQSALLYLVKGLDAPVVEYLASTINDDPYQDAEDLYYQLSEVLLWYDAVKDNAAAMALCQKITSQLLTSGIVDSKGVEQAKAAKAKQGWVVASESTRDLLKEGQQVLALYSQDSRWYPATMMAIHGQGEQITDYFTIKFNEYGNMETVPLLNIKVKNSGSIDNEQKEGNETGEGESTSGTPGETGASGGMKMLERPFCIADHSREKVKEEEKVEEEKEVGPTKKEMKALAKEKKKLELARQREIKRAEREEEQREEAIKMYLSASSKSKSKNIDIMVSNFNMSSPDGSQELLQNATFNLNYGRRYGLIGSNGVGKTTLLRCIAHYEVPGVANNIRIVHVEQESRGSKDSALQVLLKADVELQILLYEERTLKRLMENSDAAVDENETPEDRKFRELQEIALRNEGGVHQDPALRLEAVYRRMQEVDADRAEARASAILRGLQFTPERMLAPVNTLSGGWRMRVNLAQALFVQPDLLMLDEPTNHLDFPAVLWLTEYLNSYPKTVVVISHDRVFLNEVITDVMHFYRKSLTVYKGDYSSFEKVRTMQIKQAKAAFEAQSDKRAHIQEFIDKFRYNAKRASLVQSRIKSLVKMDTLEEVEEDAVFTMEFPETERLEGNMIDGKDLTFGYKRDGILLLENVTCSIDMDSRIGCLGANGVGKSTLINLLLGHLEPLAGRVERNGNCRMATFTQHHMDQLNLQQTPLEYLMEIFPKNHPQIIRRHLGKFGVVGNMQTQIMGSLSGGQKSRVAFAIITWTKPHVIIMDEPTNHLDLETVDALIGAIQGWTGGLCVVSHDQHFLGSVCREFWSVSGKKVKRFTSFKEAKDFGYSNVA